MSENNNYYCAVKVGQKVENFSAQAVFPTGESKEVSLKHNMKKGKWTILLFYPADFSFVCPTEITAMSDKYDLFEKEKAEVLGISTDTVHSHLAWTNLSRDNGGIDKIRYPLIDDANHSLSNQFGVLIPEDGLALRGLFIISPKGILEHATINNLNVGRSVDETLRVLEALKSGGLCPIDWKKGDDTL